MTPVRFLLAGLALVPAWALASSVIARTVGERAKEADRVVLAQVLDSRTLVPQDDPRRMLTVTTVLVQESYKGSGPQRLEVVQLGGTHGLWEAHIPGDATFAAGEVALLLLRCGDPAHPARCNLMALGEGKLLLVGEDVLLRSIAQNTFTRRKLAEVLAEIRAAVGLPLPVGEGKGEGTGVTR
ncbi:MAG: hypothetical protein ACOZIN_06440 [Myxococcota bacterium]